MTNIMLVITIVFNGFGAEQSVVLSTGLTPKDCAEMIYMMEPALKVNAVLTCELDIWAGN